MPEPLPHSPEAVAIEWGSTEIPVTHNAFGPLGDVWDDSVGLGFEDLEEFSKASVYKCVYMLSFSSQEKQKDEKQGSHHPRA